jgi:TetR/AcrR family transcriptional regulator, transcriptional repressor for nem operon
MPTGARKNKRAAPSGGDGDTAQRILDVAEQLVQVRGFNAFSYADVAGELGITKAALHYHYPGKAELGEALVARYTSRFAEALQRIEAEPVPASAKLDAYLGLYVDVLRAGRMCLCGMLAAEYETLSQGLRKSILRFFDDNEAWLAGVLEQGRKEGSLHFEGAPIDTARALISGLEGAMLVARPYADPNRFERNGAALLATLAGIDRKPARKR